LPVKRTFYHFEINLLKRRLERRERRGGGRVERREGQVRCGELGNAL
jgi:hypothetical protein